MNDTDYAVMQAPCRMESMTATPPCITVVVMMGIQPIQSNYQPPLHFISSNGGSSVKR